MTASSKTEFYADRAVDQIENSIKIIYKVIWWIWPTVFWIYFFGLWFLPKDIQKVIGDIGSRLLANIPVSDTILYSIAFLALDGRFIAVPGSKNRAQIFPIPQNGFYRNCPCLHRKKGTYCTSLRS